MYSILLRKLNIIRNEAGLIFLLFLAAILQGGFLSSFDILTHGTFFRHWQSIDITMAYIFAGGLGVILSIIYSFLHKRLHYKVFHGVNLVIIFVLVTGYTVAHELLANEQTAFFGLVVMFPVNLLSLMSFWRLHRIIIYPKQTKRIFPIIEFGVLLGIVIGCIAVSWLGKIYSSVLLYRLMILFLGVQIVLQVPIHKIHQYNPLFNHKTERRIPVRFSLFTLWSVKSTRHLLLFVLISAIIGYYLHYGFMNITRIKYFSEPAFSSFYSWYLIAMFAVIAVVDRYLIRKIFYSYDSPYSLVLLPIGVAIFFLATLFGSMFLQRMNIHESLPFILLIGINKIVFEASKNTMQIPSVRTIYRTLDIRMLQIAIPRVEGLIVTVGLLVTGVMLFFTHKYLAGILSYVLAGIAMCILWFYTAVRLIKSYKAGLQESYRKLRISRSGVYKKQTYREKLRRILVVDDPAKVIPVMRISSKLEPLTYERSLQRMLANPEPTIHNYVLECIQKESMLELLPELKKIDTLSTGDRTMLKQVLKAFKERKAQISKGDIQSLISSLNINDRILAAEIIGSRKDDKYTSSLVNLTREIEPDVKLAAVKSMARISSANYSYLLIEFLMSEDFHAYAFEALVKIGDPALDYLERLFINPNTSDDVLSRVIRIYGQVATPKAVDYLLDKLENQSKRITLACIAALHDANFQANNLNVHRILNVIVRTIHVIGWNFMILISLPGKEEYSELKQAYGEEIDINYDLLFDLLSLAYNAHTIREISELLLGSAADVSHAIELLDHFIYEDIKPVLFPVVENISMKERVHRLQYYFPIETMSVQEMISSTLTRDYNLLSMYPRICAMQLALQIDTFEVNQELISNLFHPNPLLCEVAALVVHKKDEEMFESIIERLDEDVQFEIRESLERVNNEEKLLLVEKYNYLKQNSNFDEIPEGILIEIALTFKEIKFGANDILQLENNMNEYALFLMIEGQAVMKNGDEKLRPVQTGEICYAEVLINSKVSQIQFDQDSAILVIDSGKIQALLFDYSEVASCILSCVEQFKMAG